MCQLDLPKQPTLFFNLHSWYERARDTELDRPSDIALLEHFKWDELEGELAFLKEKLKEVKSPVVFCHNDLIANNIMQYEDGQLVVIDYEYGSYNYRGYDFADMMCEWVIDYSIKEYPYFKVISFVTLHFNRI